MYDLHGKSVNGENKGRMQQAFDDWEKSAKETAVSDNKSDDKYDDSGFDAEVKNIIKSNFNEMSDGGEQETEKPPETETGKTETGKTETGKTEPMIPSQQQEEDDGLIEADSEKYPNQQKIQQEDDMPAKDGTEQDEDTYDFEFWDQADEFIDEQESLKTSLVLRCAGCMVCTVVLVLLALAPALKIQLPDLISISGHPERYIATNLVLLFLAGIIGASVAFKGITNLFTFKPDADGMTSLSFYAALIGGIYMLYCYATSVLTKVDLPATAVFTSCAAACLSFNLLGKVFLVARVKNNLKFISTLSNEKDFYTAAQVSKEKANVLMRAFDGTPSVVTTKKTAFLSNYLEQSYAVTPSDSASMVLAPIALIVALVAAAFELFIKNDISGAIAAFTAVCCAGAPLMFEVGVSVPFYLACRRLVNRQALVTGCETVTEFGDADAVVADAGLLFPGKYTRIYGIKPFSGYNIENVVLYAAGIACAGESSLAGAFMQMFADAGLGKKLLKTAEKVVYEDEKGLSAIIDGKVVLLGNRRLLRHHLIDAPSRDFEMRYTADDRDVAYLAVDGVICAIFVLGYSMNDKAAYELRRLQRLGVQILVKSSDPNITPQLFEEKCDIPANSVTVLGAREMQVLKDNGNDGRFRAGIAFKNMEGYAAAVTSCVKLRGSQRANTVLQSVFSVVGMLLVLYAAFFADGIKTVTPALLLSYQAICAVPVLLISLLRRD